MSAWGKRTASALYPQLFQSDAILAAILSKIDCSGTGTAVPESSASPGDDEDEKLKRKWGENTMDVWGRKKASKGLKYFSESNSLAPSALLHCLHYCTTHYYYITD